MYMKYGIVGVHSIGHFSLNMLLLIPTGLEWARAMQTYTHMLVLGWPPNAFSPLFKKAFGWIATSWIACDSVYVCVCYSFCAVSERVAFTILSVKLRVLVRRLFVDFVDDKFWIFTQWFLFTYHAFYLHRDLKSFYVVVYLQIFFFSQQITILHTSAF